MKWLMIIALGAVASAAHANLITNGSFEAGSFAPNGDNTMQLPPGATNIAGWTVIADSIAWIADPNPFNGLHASDGIKSLDLTNYFPGAPYGGVAQTIATTIGTAYRVSFDIGSHPVYSAVSSLTVSAAGAQQTFTVTAGDGQRWDHTTWDFTANSTSTTLTFVGEAPSYNYVGLDNVVVELSHCSGPPDGDLNRDAQADGDDIQPFVAAAFAHSTASEILCHADFNGDGTVEAGDVPGLVAVLLN